MKNRDIGLIVGGSIALAIAAIGLVICGIRRINQSIKRREIDDSHKEVKFNEQKCKESKLESDNLLAIRKKNEEKVKRYKVLEKLLKTVDDLNEKMDDSNERMDAIAVDQEKLKNGINEVKRGMEENDRNFQQNVLAAEELLNVGQEINAAIKPQVETLKQDRETIEKKLKILDLQEKKSEIIDIMSDTLDILKKGLEQIVPIPQAKLDEYKKAKIKKKLDEISSDEEHNTLEVSSETLDNLWKDVDELQIRGREREREINELKKGQEETNRELDELQKADIERGRRLDELKKDSDRTTIAAKELVAFGKAINAELAPQAAALAQDKKMIERKLDALKLSENKVVISNLMLDGLEQVDELLIRRGVLTPSDSFDYDGGKGNGVGL